MSNRRLVVGNWKMNPGTLAEAKKIARKVKRAAAGLEKTEVVICPPFTFVAAVKPRQKSKNFALGAQSVSVEEGVGAHTGEVSAAMLSDIGAEFAIVGHSEQRKKGDTDEMVAQRLKAALDGGLTPIVCVGETVRDKAGAYMEGLKDQIKNSLALAPKIAAKNIIIAYEPVWAIGAKEPMVADQIYETSIFVKKAFADIFGSANGLKVRVLYGGAVNFRNAYEIMTAGKVDGLLVGRESVNTPGFIELLKAVDRI
ncbi:triose-phosphate isomerase [Patescibacteria group bacterium]|nr:triose-phosphate isomerase [Patescibacteria group bacterium]MDE1946692.1 triose-phosphate isomerase [Patescibacteria group bacterium]MDE2010645.1 triose-phosphate isomerase [Patescibacteria group bacterium]MDE2233317.1 triose-phosphate isomerase [Patescibacteria group bacterium]